MNVIHFFTLSMNMGFTIFKVGEYKYNKINLEEKISIMVENSFYSSLALFSLASNALLYLLGHTMCTYARIKRHLSKYSICIKPPLVEFGKKLLKQSTIEARSINRPLSRSIDIHHKPFSLFLTMLLI